MLIFTISWQMRSEERSFDEKTRCEFWNLELNSEWNIKYLCKQNKQNLAFMEIHRKSFSGERIISGTLEICEEKRQCLLKKKFISLLEDNCFFTSIDLRCADNATILPPKMLLFNGEITISGYMEASCDLTELVHMTNTDYLSLSHLSNDMEKLLLDKSPLADVILKCGDVFIPANKSILSARSAVFEAMLSCPMNETMENEVVIEDIEAPVLQDVVKYIHTGRIADLEIIKDKPLYVLNIAKKYQIACIEYICCRLLLRFMSKENILLLPLDRSLSSDLKNYAIDYIANKVTDFSVLEKDKIWINWKNNSPSLAVEILSGVVKFREQKLKMRI